MFVPIEFYLYSCVGHVGSCLGDHIYKGNVFGQVIKTGRLTAIKIGSKYFQNSTIMIPNLKFNKIRHTPGEMTVTYKADLCLGAVYVFLARSKKRSETSVSNFTS